MEVSDIAVPGSTAVHEMELDGLAGTPDESNEKRGTKRSAEDDDDYDNSEYDDNDATARDTDTPKPVGTNDDTAPMTKSQLKKLKRQKRWEDAKEGRRLKRRDKRHERQARRRVEREDEAAAAAAEGRELAPVIERRRNRTRLSARVPVTIILDCQFEKYMQDVELVSLSSQVTRCYSDNRGAPHPVHLYLSSFGGLLKERYETVLENQHLQWKGIRLCEGDFVEVANEAKDYMSGPKGGEMIDLLKPNSSGDPVSLNPTTSTNPKKARATGTPEPEAEDVNKSIVYLTADSPYTLDRLEPNTCYVVGGIIDKNREKGLCYRIAREKNVRTAKLPIGEYMVLQHRHILATNHVVEIMLKWLETGDWGTAFMQVIPTRKGGQLKASDDTPLDTQEESVEGPETATFEDETQGEEKAKFDTQTLATNTEDVIEVEGDNADEGLAKNSLDESRWSAPPLELEKEEAIGVVTNGMAN